MEDVLFWSRLQFGFTITYHYLFPQLTMGLAWLLVFWKWRALCGDAPSAAAARFWARIFGLTFALGFYPLTQLWASGWTWGDASHSHYPPMIVVLYFVLGVFVVVSKNKALSAPEVKPAAEEDPYLARVREMVEKE